MNQIRENDPAYRPDDCPKCGNDAVYTSGMYDYEALGIEFHCSACGLRWYENYEYKGIEVAP